MDSAPSKSTRIFTHTFTHQRLVNTFVVLLLLCVLSLFTGLFDPFHRLRSLASSAPHLTAHLDARHSLPLLSAPGALDPTFGIDGKVTTSFPGGLDTANDVAVQADGRIVVAGSSSSDFALTRYNTDGSLDQTFGTGGRVHTNFPIASIGVANALVIQPDGKIILAGNTTNNQSPFLSFFTLARYNTDGSLDTSFGSGGATRSVLTGGQFSINIIYDLALQPDGKIIAVGGAISATPRRRDYAVVRYNTDGSADSSFNARREMTNTLEQLGLFEAHAVAIQADGKIVVAGPGRSGFVVARFNHDGSLDTSFDTDGALTTSFGGYLEEANDLAIQSDGKIIAFGSTTMNPETNDNFAMARYNPDGSLDTSFDTDGKVITNFDLGDWGRAVVIQTDGKIVVAGNSNVFFPPGDSFSLARYNTNGSLDTSFGTGGKVLTDFSGGRANSGAFGLALQTDGRIIAAGDANHTGQRDFGVARYNTDGTLDTSFDTDGKAVTDFPLNEEGITGLAVQTNGKIVAVGRFNNPVRILHSQNPNFQLARYNANGSLDTTFGTGGLVSTGFPADGDDFANAVALQPDGKIIVVGQTGVHISRISNPDISSFALARYNADGTLDNSFGTGGLVSTNFSEFADVAYGVALQPDGKIVVVGTSANDFLTARYNTDGSLDSGAADDSTPSDMFGTDGKVTTNFSERNESANAVVIQPDGKIVAAGFSFLDFALARYNPDGSPDTSFDLDGKVLTDFGGADAVSNGADAISALVVQADGKLLAAGNATTVMQGQENSDFAVARYNTDGSLDTNFDADGKATTNFGHSDTADAIALQANGKIVVAGFYLQNFGSPTLFALARYKTDGQLDSSFGTDGKVTTDFFGINSEAAAVVIQSDGKIVAGGYTETGSSRDFALARYQAADDPTPTPTATPTPCPVTINYTVSEAVVDLRGDTLRISGGSRSMTLAAVTTHSDLFYGTITLEGRGFQTPSAGFHTTFSQTITFDNGVSATFSNTIHYSTSSHLRGYSIEAAPAQTVDLGARGKLDISLSGRPFNNNCGNVPGNITCTTPARTDDVVFLLHDIPGGTNCPLSHIQFSASTYEVNEGAGSALITVARSGDTSAPASVEYATAPDSSGVGCNVTGGIASERCDFTTTLGTLRFAAGDVSKTFRVFITDDVYLDGNETFTLSLSQPSGVVSPGKHANATVTITDNDTNLDVPNPVDAASFFVGTHYIDFLNREGEPAGVSAWVNALDTCAAGNQACDRVGVSASFFRAEEFMLKGFFVIRFYKVSLGTPPNYREFTRDSQRVTAQTAAEVAAAREAFTGEWVERADFKAIYEGLSNQGYVDKLEQTAGVSLANKAQLVAALDAQAKTRAQVMGEVVESGEVRRRMYHDAFVLMEYYGYLRRDPDVEGFNAWLNYLNTHPGNFRTMVQGFINSVEYRKRFGAPGAPKPG